MDRGRGPGGNKASMDTLQLIMKDLKFDSLKVNLECDGRPIPCQLSRPGESVDEIFADGRMITDKATHSPCVETNCDHRVLSYYNASQGLLDAQNTQHDKRPGET